MQRFLTVFGMLAFFTNVNLNKISGSAFILISLLLSNSMFLLMLDSKSLSVCPIDAGFPQGCVRCSWFYSLSSIHK